MGKLGFTHIIVSIPRLAIGAILVGALLGSTQLTAPPKQAQSQPLHPQTVSVKTTTIPYTAAPQAVTEPAPKIAPVTETVAPKPTVTAIVTHSVTPAPVVTPAPSASVSGLAPVNPTSTPSSSSSPSSSSGSTTPPAPSSPTTTSYTSTNWSGYFAAASVYTGISGSWTVPKITTGGTRTSADAAWIGIGGVTSDDLIQVGTDDTVTTSGHQTASAFYELLPNVSQPISSLNVSPGDAMTASLSEVSTGQWKISITDTTTGQSYTNTVAYTSSHSSAEWIEEDPSTTFNRLMPLDSFGAIAFTDAAATTSAGALTPASGNAQPITMLSSAGSTSALPSALSGSNSFTVTRQ